MENGVPGGGENERVQNGARLRRTERLGWLSVLVTACSLIPAAMLAAGVGGPRLPAVMLAILCAGLIGLLAWYFQVRGAVRKLHKLTGGLERRTAELESSLNNSKELEKVKKTFMRMASHQLRAPLAAMLSCMRVLAAGDVEEDDARKLLHDAQARGEDMMELVNDILNLAQAETVAKTGTNLSVEDIAVEETAREITGFFAPRAAEKGVTFFLDVKSPLPALRANRKQFSQLVVNLVSNAFRYSDPGRRVVVTLSGGGGALMMQVTNWGLVIPEGDRQNIFREFWRGDDAKKFVERGTGLGLTIVKNIVDNWGGRIDVESDAGRGTRFTVEIPLNVNKGGNGNGTNGKEKDSDH